MLKSEGKETDFHRFTHCFYPHHPIFAIFEEEINKWLSAYLLPLIFLFGNFHQKTKFNEIFENMKDKYINPFTDFGFKRIFGEKN